MDRDYIGGPLSAQAQILGQISQPRTVASEIQDLHQRALRIRSVAREVGDRIAGARPEPVSPVDNVKSGASLMSDLTDLKRVLGEAEEYLTRLNSSI
ncbi:MAG: hypothetical protein KF802_16355 [Bdellovibrionaceae bacterium]|nr:hypothetical protein [Pseudobdellovibrionaceae bacterium]